MQNLGMFHKLNILEEGKNMQTINDEFKLKLQEIT
jgi:hypothetical protein